MEGCGKQIAVGECGMNCIPCEKIHYCKDCKKKFAEQNKAEVKD